MIGIGVSTVASAIDITIYRGMDTDGITAIDGTRDVVTAIDVRDMSAVYERSCRQFVREIISRQVRTWDIFAIDGWFHVGHTAAAEDIIHLQCL